MWWGKDKSKYSERFFFRDQQHTKKLTKFFARLRGFYNTITLWFITSVRNSNLQWLAIVIYLKITYPELQLYFL